jgi:hypothetical protein
MEVAVSRKTRRRTEYISIPSAWRVKQPAGSIILKMDYNADVPAIPPTPDVANTAIKIGREPSTVSSA